MEKNHVPGMNVSCWAVLLSRAWRPSTSANHWTAPPRPSPLGSSSALGAKVLEASSNELGRKPTFRDSLAGSVRSFSVSLIPSASLPAQPPIPLGGSHCSLSLASRRPSTFCPLWCLHHSTMSTPSRHRGSCAPWFRCTHFSIIA